MAVTIHVPGALRSLTRGESSVTVSDVTTLAEVLDALAGIHPGVVHRVLDEQGRLRRHVSVFVGEDNVKDLDGLDTRVTDGVEVSIIPAVSGGE
jgi:molybdopterin converting factor small subunit